MTNSFSSRTPGPATDKLDEYIASLPGMAFKIELLQSGTISFAYVSQGCLKLLGVSPSDLLSDPAYLLNLIHPEDNASFLENLGQSAQTMHPWEWQGRILLSDNKIKWVSLNSAPSHSNEGYPYWKGIMLDITASKLNELEFKQNRQQLQDLSSHIHEAKEQERLHIAREVHDEIGSLLTAIKIDLSWLMQQLTGGDVLLTEKTKTIETLVNRVITSANNLAHRLRPGALDQLGLIAAIEIEAQEFSKRSGISCTLTTSQEDIELSDTHSITLFRILQETLNNILKHAHAKNAQVEVVKGTDHLELIISDDGVGFSEAARNKPRSFGLRGIHERIAYLGGTVTIASSSENGTQIAIFIPLETGNPATPTPHQALFGNT